MGCTSMELTFGNVTWRPLFSLLGRFTQSLESEPADSPNPNHLSPPPDILESSLSSVPSDSPDHFSTFHSSLAPPNITSSPYTSPSGIAENLSFLDSFDSMADKKKRAPMPPSNSLYGTQNGGSLTPIREISNPAYVEADNAHQGKRMSVPLPDYETLFPQKRHGVQGQTRWDHIIAQVNQRHRDLPSEFSGPEMSVDGPEDQGRSIRPSPPQTYQTQSQETKPVSSKKVAAPPKPLAPPHSQPAADFNQRHGQNAVNKTVMQPNQPVAPAINKDALSRESPSMRPEARKALQPPSAPRPVSQWDRSAVSTDDQSTMQVTVNNAAPRAKPRQKASGHEVTQPKDSAVTPLNSNNQVLSNSSMSGANKKSSWPQESFADVDPFPSTDLFPKDPWAQVNRTQQTDDPFRGSALKDQKFEDLGMTPDDLDDIFRQDKGVDPFAVFNGSDSKEESVYRGKYELSEQASPAFQRSRQSEIPPSATLSNNKILQPLSTYVEETPISKVNQGFSAQPAKSESVTPKHQADVKTTSHVNVQDDPFGTEPFSAWSPSQPLHGVQEEPESHAESMSGGKAPFRAWVSPSDVQSVSAQSSNGGGLAFTPRR